MPLAKKPVTKELFLIQLGLQETTAVHFSVLYFQGLADPYNSQYSITKALAASIRNESIDISWKTQETYKHHPTWPLFTVIVYSNRIIYEGDLSYENEEIL